MDRLRIITDNWAMSRTLTDSYGEELWTVIPKEGNWIAVIHLQPSGKMYLSLVKEGKRSSKIFINQEFVVESLQQLAQWVYEERGLCCMIGVSAKEGNAKLFSTVRKAGFRRTSEKIKVRKKTATIIFRYSPKLKCKELESKDYDGGRAEDGQER